jgi:iron complex outermembrane recepter protein
MTRLPRLSRLHLSLFGPARTSSRTPTSVVLLMLAAAVGGPAFAQATDQGVQTVTVTATKRAQSLQEVPLSVTALKGEDLDRKGIQRWEDALTGEPSVSISTTGSALGNNIAIRGVSDGTGGLTQSTVAIYIDEMPVTVAQYSGNPSLLLYDIDKVTVIRGPRSTLYGSSSLGGTLKIETLNPGLKRMEGFARVGYGRPSSSSAYNTELAASVSVPLSTDVAALGVTAYRVGVGGALDSPTLGKDVDGQTTKGARIAFFAQPARGFTVAAKLYAQDFDAKATTRIDAAKGSALIGPTTAVLEPSTDKFRGGTLTLKYKTDAFEIVSATSHFDKTANYIGDLTGFFGPVLAGFGVAAGTPIVTNGLFASKVSAQELRLVSNEVKTGLFWSAGLFYSDETTDNNASTPSPIGEIFGSLTKFKHKQTAIFGEAGYKLASGFELAGGIRRTNYKADDRVSLSGIFAVPGVNASDKKETPLTPYLSAAYRFDGQMVYAQASKGFRPGKANFPVIPVPGFDVPKSAAADSLWTYELGAKSSWLNNRVTANASVYYTDWSNPQLTLSLPTGFTYINSIGALSPGAGAKIKGFEFELVARPMPELRVSAGIGYTDATFTKDVKALDPSGALVKAGSRLASIPRVTASASLRYDFAIMSRSSVFDASLRHSGSYYNDYNSATKQLIGDMTTLDLRLTMSFGENFDVAAYVNNATDARPLTTLNAAPFNFGTTIRPRTIGITGTYRF